MKRQNDSRDTTETRAPERAKKGGRSRALVVTGIVVAVVAALGFAGLVWHEQPSFCGAICHTPMAAYVDGFLGNDVTLLADEHASADVACLTCHVATMEQQIEEARSWVSGDFVFYEETGLLYPRKIGTAEFCTQSGCHSDNEALIAATESYEEFNPHGPSHNGQLECFTCHDMHRQSSFYCAECHQELEVPDGWTVGSE